MTDKYVNSYIAAGKRTQAVNVAGDNVKVLVCTFEVAAADADGDVYRIAQDLNPNLIPIKITVLNDAITAGTDWDLGLYKPSGGAVLDKDVFADGADMSSAATSTPKDGLVTVDIANRAKKLYEHAGHTISTKIESYDLAFTANTVGTAAGTITVIAEFVQG